MHFQIKACFLIKWLILYSITISLHSLQTNNNWCPYLGQTPFHILCDIALMVLMLPKTNKSIIRARQFLGKPPLRTCHIMMNTHTTMKTCAPFNIVNQWWYGIWRSTPFCNIYICWRNVSKFSRIENLSRNYIGTSRGASESTQNICSGEQPTRFKRIKKRKK